MRLRRTYQSLLNRLPAELICLVLGFCDIYTLPALATTSKRICVVFRQHTCALVASALRTSLWCPHPEVYRLISRSLRLRQYLARHHGSELSEALNAIDSAKPDVVLGEGPFFPTSVCFQVMLKHYSISHALLPLVIERATVARTLELRFSRTAKDKRSGHTSTLTESESEHFQLALHRVWLLGDVYNAGSRYTSLISPDDPPTKEHVDTWFMLLEPLPTTHIWHLSNLFDWFETEDQQWDFDPATRQHAVSRILKRTPTRHLYRAPNYRNPRIYFLDPERWNQTGEYIKTLLQGLLLQRGVILEGDRAKYEASEAVLSDLLPSDHTSKDVCARAHLSVPLPQRRVRYSNGIQPVDLRAHSANGMFLWNHWNWEHLTERDLDGTISDLLSRNLAENNKERTMLEQHIRDLEVTLQVSSGGVLAHIIRELFSLTDEIKHPLDLQLAESIQNDGYDQILPDDWLCTKCVRELLRRRLFVWWAVQRRAGKVANAPTLPTENCRHGILCYHLYDTDASSRAHVHLLNHLCHSVSGKRREKRQEGRDRRRAERSQKLEVWNESQSGTTAPNEQGPSMTVE